MADLLDDRLPVHVFNYRQEDRPYLVDIDVKGCDWAWTYEDWRRQIGLNVCFVARGYGHIGGFLVADCSYRPIANIVKLVVHRKFRRLGVGSRLVNYFLREAIACDFTKVTMTVPERSLDPRSPDDVSAFMSQWFKSTHVERDAFNVDGEVMDGVVFETYL